LHGVKRCKTAKIRAFGLSSRRDVGKAHHRTVAKVRRKGGLIMHLSPLHLLVLALVVLVLFGKGKVSNLMGDFGRGITAFKNGVSDGSAEL
jgi:sec-independent protein translocase protein TatA